MTRPELEPIEAAISIAITLIVGACWVIGVVRWSCSEGRRRALAVRRLRRDYDRAYDRAIAASRRNR